MGDAKRRKALNLEPRGIRPEPPPVLQRHTLAMIDRRVERDANGKLVFSDHSAKPGPYASADLKNLYRWDGIRLRRLDKIAQGVDNLTASVK
ncbi:MAG TPA: hypothetical protein VHL34_24805 [Rhizomicrobium sp.]|jgi:hypothetical protein|nr:hypothetical protein [Rhizomicrobium sp.]